MFQIADHRQLRKRAAAFHPGPAALWLWGLIALHSALAFAVFAYLDQPASGAMSGLLITLIAGFLPLFTGVVAVVQTVRLVVSAKDPRPARTLILHLRSYLSNRAAVAQSVVTLACLIAFVDAFTRLKGAIPVLHPFAWDARLAQLDRALHGGIDPWVWLHPITQNPAVIRAMDMAYAGWFVVLYFAVVLAVFGRANAVHRHAFLIGFVLVWAVGGNGLAVIFSSAGPTFYAQIGLGDMFAPLTAHLDAINAALPLSSHIAKDAVWHGYAAGGAFASISAFPSMHVGSTALITLFAFSYGRLAGWLTSVFFALIMAGSVALAWHYAVDGYAGIALAWAAWRAGQRIAARA